MMVQNGKRPRVRRLCHLRIPTPGTLLYPAANANRDAGCFEVSRLDHSSRTRNTMVEIQETEPAARTRPAKPRLFSPAAAAVIAVVGLALLPSQDALPAEETSPGEESVAVDLPSPKAEAASFVEAEAVAASFMAAWVRGDGRAAASLFAAEGKFHGVEPGMLATLHDWYRAVGREIQSEGCELISPTRSVVSSSGVVMSSGR